MNAFNSSAVITMLDKKWQFYYNNTVALTLGIHYPQIEIPDAQRVQNKINGRIEEQTQDFYYYASGTLYYQAVQEYKDSISHDFPFRPYDAVLNYQPTFNESCYLSMYRDKYEYTGGAHGNTNRESDTWSLKTGRNLPLSYFFDFGENYRRTVIDQILALAEQNMKENPNIYFDEYSLLIQKYFNPKNYYLTSDGIAVYYQQYEIAPYSTGIVVFTIPYEKKPSCL